MQTDPKPAPDASGQSPQPPGSPPPPIPAGPPQRLPSGQHPQPQRRTTGHVRLPTGQHRLPSGQNRLPSGPQRLTSGQHRLPSHPAGVHFPDQPYAAPHFARTNRAEYSLYVILGLVLLGVGVLYFVTRDRWEQNNRAAIMELKRDADAARSTQKLVAYQKYDSIIKMVSGHTLNDTELKYVYNEAKRQRLLLQEEMGAAKETGGKPDEPAADAEYSKYIAKSQPLLDALLLLKADVEAGQNQKKYQDDVREMVAQYVRWEAAVSSDEVRYHSARLFKVARDSFNTGSSWWSIETDQKMPDAMYAQYMRKNEWSKADSALLRIKTCIQAKELMPQKQCGPCGGSGKVKCPICEGSGICAYCKGKGNPTLNCCKNGVCNACVGRKESGCPICNGTGQFPPK